MTVSVRLALVPCALVGMLLVSCSPDTGEPPRDDPSGTASASPSGASSSHQRTTGTARDDAGGSSTSAPRTQPSEASEPSGPRPGDAASGTSDEDDPPSADPSRTRTAPALPDGDEPVLEGRRMVALYGTPGTASLGALGAQPLDAAVRRVRRLARAYEKLTEDAVVPAFELIASVASTRRGPDGNFSSELPISTLRPWIERAAKEGVYVVLDLQPGRTGFLAQAKHYAPLLRYPHVGLALDPEWRLGPNQRHLEQIGSVHGKEVNATIDWLARLTRDERLPQKLVVLHQFRTDMIDSRGSIDADREHVSVLIHADGQGTQAAKRGTWKALHKGAPKGVHWGWKNFIDEDHPMLTPKQTYRIAPPPRFVSYQ